MEVIQPEIIKISTFSDDDIRKLMEKCCGITDRVYTDRIVAIAEGNARLAMLAGKFATDSGNLSAIQDASDLYHNYTANSCMPLSKVRQVYVLLELLHCSSNPSKHLESLPNFEVAE